MAQSGSESGSGVLQKFTNKLLNTVSEKDNYLVSPVSIEIVLGMVHQGTAGETAAKTAKILQATDKKSAAVEYKKIIESLNNLTSVTLSTANKMYVMKDFPLKSTFKNALQDSFFSRTDLVNFAESDKTATEINEWVESQTNNKIKDLISAQSLNALTRLVLVNALYFKGDWAIPFKVEDTNTEAFYVNDDETVECEMMFVFDDFKMSYSDKLKSQLVELPYKGNEASMIIILPQEYDGIDTLEKELANVDLSTLMGGSRGTRSVEVYLPKFKIEATTNIKPLLEKMGLTEIFDPSAANFSDISEKADGLFVSEFLQKTYIDVNEQGTEAAAATQCGMMLMSGPKRFTVDHPFMFVLQSHGDNGNTPLFVGKVMHPSYTLPF